MRSQSIPGKITLSLLCFLITLCFSAQCLADFSYTIQKGDNPYNLAKKFNVRVQDILEINTINPKKLRPGMKITIPSSDQESHSNRYETLPSAENRNQSGEEGNHMTGENPDALQEENATRCHLVEKGDTLLAIARRYSVSVSELRKLNDLDSSLLRIGQKLLLRHTNPGSYTVRKGDNLYKIAKRFDVSLEELREINDLDSDLLRPGQQILLEHEPEPQAPKQYDTILSRESRIHSEEETEPELQEQSLHERLVLFAKKLLNIPYRFGGNSMFGIDCSAYVQKVYNLIGIKLPRSAREQFTEGNPVDRSELTIGDLVFFRTYASFPSHVGIYLGNNLFIHASSKSKKVTIDSLDTPYYLKRYIGAKRLIQDITENERPFQQDG